MKNIKMFILGSLMTGTLLGTFITQKYPEVSILPSYIWLILFFSVLVVVTKQFVR